MSVSIRSPIITVERAAATDPAAGRTPAPEGPVGSGLVATNRAPSLISRIAVVTASKL
jgi:hypothetical protein